MKLNRRKKPMQIIDEAFSWATLAIVLFGIGWAVMEAMQWKI